jgi:pimeloyl-ACP methyl ester carboxylesterase
MRERPVLLVLHGGPAFDHTVNKHLLAPLQEVAQVVFIDQRACGRSDDGPREKWNLDSWIDDIHAFCSAVELEHPILLGQSFGGFVALGVAARYPELPARLIVSSSAARIRQDRALAMFDRLGGPEIREVAARWFEDPNPASGEEYRRRCLPTTTRRKEIRTSSRERSFAKTSAFISGEMRSDGSISSRRSLGSVARH